MRLLSCLLPMLYFMFSCQQESTKTYLFVGSYTGGESADGIYVYELSQDIGELLNVEIVGNLINPSFITLSSDGQFLYACTETQMVTPGNVSAFSIDESSGKIEFLNKQSTGARNPVHLMFDKSNRYLFAANYTDASLNVFERQPNGLLEPYAQKLNFQGSSIVEGRQDEAHIHASFISPDNGFLVAPDLGADQLRVFSFDTVDLLTEEDSLTVLTTKGAGPRHFTFHPNLPYAYCIEELSGNIAFYQFQNGQLKLIETYQSYEKMQDIYSSADIHISPDGLFLYTSNRYDENSIATFTIDQDNGALTLVAHESTYGVKPRNFAIDPSGNFLIVANQDSDNLVVFRRNLTSGELTKVHEVSGIKSPSCLKMYAYD